MRLILPNIEGRVKHLGRKNYCTRQHIQGDKITFQHKDGKASFADLFAEFVDATTIKRLRLSAMGGKASSRIN